MEIETYLDQIIEVTNGPGRPSISPRYNTVEAFIKDQGRAFASTALSTNGQEALKKFHGEATAAENASPTPSGAH